MRLGGIHWSCRDNSSVRREGALRRLWESRGCEAAARKEGFRLFGELVVAYLFFGGAGAGACAVLGFLECANASRRPAASLVVPCELMARAWPAALALLGTGALCLMADLGRPERVLSLWLAPRFSVMTLGAWALLASLVLATAFSLAANVTGLRLAPAAARVAAIAAMAAGLVTALYTGWLLNALPSVIAFDSWLVPTLFCLSSLSCGMAVVVATASFTGSRGSFAGVLHRLARVDSVLIVAEAAALAAFVAWLASHEGTQAGATALVQGSLAVPFWVLLVGAGLVAPLALERRYPAGDWRVWGLWIAGCVLLGGLFLRLCVTGLAAFDVTQMPELAFGLALLD